MAVYSHSRLETFENCALKYKFKYIDKIEKPEEQSVEAFVGSRVHEVLKQLYDDLLFGKQNTLEALLARYRVLWDENWGPLIRIVDRDRSAQDYFEFGAQCIRNYYSQHRPFNQSHTLETEARVAFPLDAAGRYQMQGFIDRIDRRDDGTYEIHDYKTSRRLPPQQEVDSERQLTLYQIGLKARWPEVERVELVWHYVRHGATLRSRRTPEQLVQLRASTVQLIDRIERTTKFEPRRSMLCDWCEYKPECPLWKHPESVAALPPEKFKANDGVRLADEYAHISLEIGRLEEQLAELREKILAFAAQQGVNVLQGSGFQVTVRATEREKFPGKNDPQRAPLETLLRRAGKWESVTELDLAALAHALEEGNWPAELVREVRSFAALVSKATVRLHPTGQHPEPGAE